MRRVHVVVSGTVQGVGYRWSLRAEAAALQVAGWVRNRRDGTVEAEVEGPAAAVEALLRWMSTGTPGAHVTRVQTDDLEPASMTGFEILRTS